MDLSLIKQVTSRTTIHNQSSYIKTQRNKNQDPSNCNTKKRSKKINKKLNMMGYKEKKKNRPAESGKKAHRYAPVWPRW